MAPSHITVKTADGKFGPHPSFIEVAKPFIFENKIYECLTTGGQPETRDDKVRLEGVSYLDHVRRSLHLPVRTFNTAVVYFHKFRLMHPESIGHIDAAAAALFAACKIEDTLKKSREILCAAHNLKAPTSDRLTPDDPLFDQHSKSIIGLERLMLEASGFDFRNRHPQRLLLKLCRHHNLPTPVANTAFNMSLDLYRTFAPLKQTSAAMAMACIELSCRLHEHEELPLPTTSGAHSEEYTRLHLSRTEVVETLFDMLDLYTNHRASTAVGPNIAVDRFLNIRIALNQEVSSSNIPSHSRPKSARAGEGKANKHLTNGARDKGGRDAKKAKHNHHHHHHHSPLSPRDREGHMLASPTSVGGTGKPGLKDGTVRFMLSAERARDEKEVVDGFFNFVEEERVIEVPVEEGRRRR